MAEPSGSPSHARSPTPNAVFAAVGVEPHPDLAELSFGGNDLPTLRSLDADAEYEALKAQLEDEAAALKADLKSTSEQLQGLETGATMEELDGLHGDLSSRIRAMREELVGGTTAALSELEALKLQLEKEGSLDAETARMVEQLAGARLDEFDEGIAYPPEVVAELESMGHTIEEYREGLAARVVDAHRAEPRGPVVTPLDDIDDIDDAEIDAHIAAMEARLEDAKRSRDEAMAIRDRLEREMEGFMAMAEEDALDPEGGATTDMARKVLEAVGGGADLDDLRRILED
jgi:hypothetical protein